MLGFVTGLDTICVKKKKWSHIHSFEGTGRSIGRTHLEISFRLTLYIQLLPKATHRDQECTDQ